MTILPIPSTRPACTFLDIPSMARKALRMHLVILGLAAAAQTIEADRPEQGKMPRGWTYARHCRRCRPVWGWLLRDGKPVGLPWCRVRRAGGPLPRPAITCATCMHQQLQPDTSAAGLHGCAIGKGLHFAREPHRCASWQPVHNPEAQS